MDPAASSPFNNLSIPSLYLVPTLFSNTCPYIGEKPVVNDGIRYTITINAMEGSGTQIYLQTK
jgi:hypothetical protein